MQSQVTSFNAKDHTICSFENDEACHEERVLIHPVVWPCNVFKKNLKYSSSQYKVLSLKVLSAEDAFLLVMTIENYPSDGSTGMRHHTSL